MRQDMRSAARADGAPPWRVGELARQTGLTVRTLHHYHAIGLLSPSCRTTGAHRLYSADDIARLQQIQSLRWMGIPLSEIAQLLGDRTDALRAQISPLAVVNAHRQQLRASVAAQTELLRRLDGIAERLADANPPTLARLCALIRQAGDTQRAERYFTPEQLASLAAVRELHGSTEGIALMQRWQELIQRVAAAMSAGEAPESPLVQALARQWGALLDVSLGADPDAAHAAREMYENDGDALASIMPHRPTREMFAFLDRARLASRMPERPNV